MPEPPAEPPPPRNPRREPPEEPAPTRGGRPIPGRGESPQDALEPQLRGARRAGSRIGSPRIVLQPGDRVLRPVAPKRWRATPAAEAAEPSRLQNLRRIFLGKPLASADETSERLDKKRALAIFASDALSSTAYATEEILLVLVLAGTLYLNVALPVSIAIAVLLGVVILSYRQTVHAYPQGGGAYSVASENLGRGPALVAAASLLTDYVLTVAVSISAGALAIVSAIPALNGYQVQLALVGLVIVTAINLRGVRESGAIFGALTYIFVGVFALMLVVGVSRLAFGSFDGASLARSAPPAEQVLPVTTLGIMLLLRAFSSGATALTGVEAIANGIQVFKAPSSRNAATTMAIMGVILACFFVGATFLAVRLGIVPLHGESVISQVARAVFGGGSPLYYVLQGSTAMILILAANTAFSGFPRLAAILASDGFMPRRFGFQDDRLTFASGIVVLALVAGLLLVGFQADTHRLIPLYAVGVFMSFSISQSGMIRHWIRSATPDRRAMAINAVGAVATGLVAVVVTVTKFTHGAWMVLLIIPGLVWMLYAVHRHYETVRELLTLEDSEIVLPPRPQPLSHAPIVVPVRRIDRLSLHAIQYSRALSDRVTAVHLTRTADAGTEAFIRRWEQFIPDVPLVVIESPYRTFLGPFFSYVDSLPRDKETIVTVVVPELETTRWWERILHNSTGDLIIRGASRRPQVIATSAAQRPDSFT